MGSTAETLSLIDRYDIISDALRRIRILGSMHSQNHLSSEEIAVLCELIYETANNAYQLIQPTTREPNYF